MNLYVGGGFEGRLAQVVFHLSTAATEWWAAAHLGSRLSHRHPLRVAQRDSVADVAEGTGLRIWHDVPAAHGSDETEGECRREGFRPARGLASLNTARLLRTIRKMTDRRLRRHTRKVCCVVLADGALVSRDLRVRAEWSRELYAARWVVRRVVLRRDDR